MEINRQLEIQGDEHDRNIIQRPSLRLPRFLEASRFHRDCNHHACTRYRREHRHLQCREQRLTSSVCHIKSPDRIIAIQELNPEGKRIQVTAANFYDWRAQNTVFEHLAAIKTTTANLALADQAERIDIAQTHANFFSVFGIQPASGRLFIPADEQAGHPPIAVLSHVLWQRRFGGDKEIVGKSITLDGKNYEVVGVAPPGFQYPYKTELWLPPLRLVPELNEQMDVTTHRSMGYLAAVALLKPGVSVRQAASEMETITSRLRQQYPDTNNKRFNRVVGLHEHLVGKRTRCCGCCLAR